MEIEPDARRFLAWTPGQARRSRAPIRERFRDSMATMMLGILSLGLGVFATCVVWAGISGSILTPWNESYSVTTATSIGSHWVHEGSEEKKWTVSVGVKVSQVIIVPSSQCDRACLFGAVFGGIGLGCGWRRQRYSMLCVTGFGLCLTAPITGMLYALFMDASA